MKHFGRYLRQNALPELGIEAQKRLLTSSVAIIGVGGLGSPLLIYLAAAGVGHLHVFDHDHVESSNLNRHWRWWYTLPLHVIISWDRGEREVGSLFYLEAAVKWFKMIIAKSCSEDKA